MTNNAPPLKLWFYVLFIVIVYVSVVLGYSYTEKGNPNTISTDYINKLKESIIINNTKHPEKKSVVIFGSSLTAHAFPDSSVVEKILFKKTKNEFTVLKIPIAALNMEKAENSKFFEYISEFPPDYLFLENNRLNIEDRNMEKLASVFHSSVNAIITYFKSISELKKDSLSKKKSNLENDFYSDKFDRLNYNFMLSKKNRVRNFSENRIANQAFSKLAKHRTKIIFIVMPRPPKIKATFINKNQKKDLENLLETYKQKYNIALWRYPYEITNSDFYDGGHMNYKGAGKYFEWFASKFDSIQ